MTLLVYAISRAGELAATRGIDGQPLRAVASPAGLAAIVGDIGDRPAATEQALVGYEAAVEAVMADRPVLPVRFGTTVPDEPAVVEFLSRRHDKLASALRRVEGALEFGVRVCWPSSDADGAAAPGGPRRGAAYLQRQLDRERRARRIADALDARCKPLARAATRRLHPRPGTAVAAAYLVDRARVDSFARACEELRTGDDVEVVCTGPWPPYSFVKDAG